MPKRFRFIFHPCGKRRNGSDSFFIAAASAGTVQIHFTSLRQVPELSRFIFHPCGRCRNDPDSFYNAEARPESVYFHFTTLRESAGTVQIHFTSLHEPEFPMCVYRLLTSKICILNRAPITFGIHQTKIDTHMITPIPFSRIKLPGLITLSERTINLLLTRHDSDPFLTSSLDRLTTAKNEATKAIGTVKGYSNTKHVMAADEDRDNSYDSLKFHIRAGFKRNNEAYQSACTRLYSILEKNGLKLARYKYDEETGALLSLFSDLDDPQAVADLATIHATDWLAELKRDQAAFEAAIQARGEERVTGDIPTDEEARRAIIPVIKSMVKVIDVAEENELVDNISATIELINDAISEIVLAHKRGTSSSNGDADSNENEDSSDDDTVSESYML